MSNGEHRGTSRSGFLKHAAGVTAVVAGASAGAGALAGGAAAVNQHRDNIKSLDLDGVDVGRLLDVSGGESTHEVVIADFDSDGNPDKRMGRPAINTMTMRIGAGLSKAVYDWISDSMRDPTVRKSGAFSYSDWNFVEVGRRSFTNAQITSVTIPRLVNRPQAFPAITVTFSVDSITDETPSGAVVVRPRPKPWLTSNFRLSNLPNNGLPTNGLPSNGISSIDSLTWKIVPGTGILCPEEMSLTVAPSGMSAWQQWYDNFAVGGDSSDERDTVLTVWGSTPQDPLFTVTLSGLGIFAIQQPDAFNKQYIPPWVQTYVSKATWDLGTAKGA